ncbi:MAG TPA: dicarboxylate/amino acid:cation symporter [Capsulimonadaceae bacterium]|jgi:DAACS family dicarboxylate/amino acid:cation (Na+ or H+) symporter
MSHELPAATAPPSTPSGLAHRLSRLPLYVQILIAMAIGIVTGQLMGTRAEMFKPASDLVLQLLRLLATPLIFIAVLHALMKNSMGGKAGARLFFLLITNTLAAILIGLAISDFIKPGHYIKLPPPAVAPDNKPFDIVADLLGKIPTNFIDGFQHNDVISIILIAIAAGVALRSVLARQEAAGHSDASLIERLLSTAFQCVMTMLQWIFNLVPLAVFAVVARTVGTSGIKQLLAMGVFVGAVLLALLLQSIFYMVRLRLGSWVRPAHFLKGASDAFAVAFSTSSSGTALPVTFACIREKIGIREESASLGVMVGGTFNHDGTALYEAMAALFISQALGVHLDLSQQVLVIVMAMIASIGAAGIPSAGLVTMLAVFNAVNLPVEYIPLLLPLDWLLDRCRTTTNVMGDMTVACLLDGKIRPEPEAELISILPDDIDESMDDIAREREPIPA